MDTGAERQTVRVTVFHQQYTLVATEQPGEVESLAREVDELMISIAQRAGNVDASAVGVLACLHLADRLRDIEREHAHLKSRIGVKSREFSLLLDRVIE